jgi:hypothetical protein
VKFLLKWAFRLFLVLLVLLAVLALSFDAIVTSIAEGKLRKQTGLEVHLDKLELRPWSGRARLEKLVIYNPAEFGGSPLVNIAELHVEYDPALAKERKLHLNVLRFNLTELNLVVSKEGQSNLDGVRRTVEKARRGERIVRTNAPMEFVGLDMLNLTLGKGSVIDLRFSSTPTPFNLGIRNEVVQDIKSMRDLVEKLQPTIRRAGLNFVFGSGKPAPTATATNAPSELKPNEAAVPRK